MHARGAATVSLVTLVAACGSQTATTSGPVSASSYTASHRSASYDPPGPPSDPWGPYIREASARFDVPERWIREVMRQESGGRATATSPVGAMGLMQVMPGTYAELRNKHGLGDDPYHPYDSIMAGTAYVRQMYDLYGSPAFLAAYNGGPRRLEEYLWAGRSMPAETRNYVARIGPRIVGAEPNRRAPPEIYAAAEIPLNVPPGPRRADTATMLALRDQREQRRANDLAATQVASLPPGPVVRMDPIADGSTYGRGTTSSVQVASLGGPVVRMDPIPDGSTGGGRSFPPEGTVVARMDPIPDGSTGPRSFQPEGTVVARMDPIPDGSTGPRGYRPEGTVVASMDPIPDGSTYSRAEPAPVAQAEPLRALPTPPPPAPGRAVAESRQAPPARMPFGVAERQPPAPAGRPQFADSRSPFTTGRSLNLIGSAQASTLPQGAVRSAFSGNGGGWAVQVGAFASENLARAAAQQASAQLGGLGTRVAVQPVIQGRNTLYRARVTGLSRESAQSACDRLRGRGACMTLSPDAQS
ncbi:transglycosylase SLT domain-containing protein [Roseomonas sp. BN140053]|uniref:transglycosylase SLT domain-containing protein n=1 Tax=Roseomonas sp. BN140053 TaxID=3391898 RepID=UPI0039E94789